MTSSTETTTTGGARRGPRMLPGTTVLVVVALVLGLVSAIALTAIDRAERDARDDVRADLGRLAYEGSVNAAQYISGRIDLLAVYGTRSAFRLEVVPQAVVQLTEFPAERTALTGGLAWYDVDGVLLARALDGRGAVGEPTVASSPEVLAFVRSVAGGGVGVSGKVTSPEFAGEVVLLAAPTADVDGVVNGVIVGAFPTSWLADVAARQSANRGTTSFIFDRDGEVLVGSTVDDYALPDVASLPGVVERGSLVFAGRSGDRDPTGRAGQVIGYAHERNLTGWTSLEVRPESVAFADAVARRQRGLAAVAVVDALGLLGAGIVARRLNRLSRRARDAEAAAERDRLRAEEEHQTLRATLDATATGTWWWDREGDRLTWSPEVRDVLGMQPDEQLPQRPVDVITTVHPDDRQAVIAALAGADGTSAVDVEFRPAAEPHRWLWIRARAIEDGQRLVGLIREVTERRAAEERVRALAEREREVAWTLQQSLLPPTLPAIPGVTIAARYRAAGPDVVVGGDFYDVVPGLDATWALSVGDVCGRGVDAATITSLARHTLRAAARHSASPATDLLWLHDALLAAGMRQYLTAVGVRMRPVDDGVFEATVAVGGHPLPVLVPTDGPAGYVGEPGTLLGIYPPKLAEVRVRLEPGDRLVLYTDGLTDSPSPRLDEDDLLAAIEATRGDAAEACADGLIGRSTPPPGGAHDDTALLVVDVVAP